jgi:hypothetical protein
MDHAEIVRVRTSRAQSLGKERDCARILETGHWARLRPAFLFSNHSNNWPWVFAGSAHIEITSGLIDGDRVVIGSRDEFRSGIKVMPKYVDASASTVGATDF